MANISVIGLGAMGAPIARNLLAAGHAVTVWNRSPESAQALAAEGAQVASSIVEAFQTGIVFSMLSDDAAVEATLLDHAVLAGAPVGAVHVDLATVSVELAQRAAELHAQAGIGYVAAPVFGRVPVAEVGLLNVLAAGDAALIDRAQPFFDVIGTRTWRLGAEPQQANAVKLLGNYLIACAIQSLGEAVALGSRAGVEPGRLTELLSATLFPGPVYSAYGAMVADRSYQPAGFTTLLGRKDVHLALDAAANVGIDLPFGEVLRDVFDEALAKGHEADDWASIAELRY